MAPFIAPPGLNCWPNAVPSEAARPEKPGSHAATGYRLPAAHVIHTVGPVWRGGGATEHDLLASCYRNSLSLARAHGLRSIAFPAISTGIYGFPRDQAAAVAARAVQAELSAFPAAFDQLLFICFDEESRAIYADAVERQVG